MTDVNTSRVTGLAAARAAKAAKARPGDELAQRKLVALRQAHKEARIAAYIEAAIATAPPLGHEQAARLSILLFGGNGPETPDLQIAA
jgi:hypothetical protein